MAKTIICSVGTSASKKLGISPKKLEDWVNQQDSLEDAAQKMFKGFASFELNGVRELTQKFFPV